VLEERVDLVDAMAAAVVARAAGILTGPVGVDSQRVILLEVLGRDRLEQRPPRVPVEPISDRARRDAAVEDLEDLVGLALRVDSGIDEVRTGAVAARHRELRQRLGEHRADHVEVARHQS
jgi:hypothetical protein